MMPVFLASKQNLFLYMSVVLASKLVSILSIHQYFGQYTKCISQYSYSDYIHIPYIFGGINCTWVFYHVWSTQLIRVSQNKWEGTRDIPRRKPSIAIVLPPQCSLYTNTALLYGVFTVLWKQGTDIVYSGKLHNSSLDSGCFLCIQCPISSGMHGGIPSSVR